MRLTLETYWPLFLLAVVPYLWWVRRGTTIDLSPKHLWLSTLLRSALIALVALALTQPVIRLTSKEVSVVYLLDVSRSVAPSAIQRALQWIEKTNGSGKPDHARFVAFASDSMPFEQLNELNHVKVSNQPGVNVINQDRTDISGAIQRAEQSFAPNHLKRLVLISDGNDNSGDLATAVSRLKAENIPVYTEPLDARSNRDVWVEAVKAPATVTAEEQFPMEVHVYSQIETTADVEVRSGDKTLGKRSVRLKEGLNRVSFETNVKDPTGAIVLEASVVAEGDGFAENNLYREPIVVLGKPRVLYVESREPSAKYLRQALNDEGFHVDVADPASLPSDITLLDAYDAVILSDVDAKTLSKPQMQAVSTYVRDLGGGFILSGGENIYGEGGYSKTEIEDALPVIFEIKKKPPSVAMVAVIDVSGSMAGVKIEVAKLAAQAPLEMLRDRDSYGVVVFTTQYTWITPLQTAANRLSIKESIGRIQSSGGTDAYPALDQAYQTLSKSTAEIKVALLLTDGQTPKYDFQTLTTKMNKAGITVSTVAVGTGADRELLTDISMWGKGRAYSIQYTNNIPQVFIHETELALGQTLRETPFKAIVNKSIEAFKGIEFDKAPQLLGFVASKAKPTSEVLLADSLANDPLLARWQYGLGKTAAFTSDLKDRWAVQWLTWDGYPKFWSQLVRDVMRRRDNENFDFHVTRASDSALVTINAIEDDGSFRNDLRPQVSVIDPSQKVTVVDVPQTGPGAYEFRMPLTEEGSYSFRAVGTSAGSPSRVVSYSYPDEYHFYPPDTAKLKAISSATGGVFQPKGPEIFDPNGQTASSSTALWPWLAGLSLAFYVLDVLLRRLRLFEA